MKTRSKATQILRAMLELLTKDSPEEKTMVK